MKPFVSSLDEEGTLLRTAEALPEDVGTGTVRIPGRLIHELGLTQNDIVELSAERTTFARVAPLPGAEDEASLARVDSSLRRNSGADLGQRLTLKRAAARPARLVVLAPKDAALTNPEVESRVVAAAILGRPFLAGDHVMLAKTGSRARFFEVHETSPAGPVVFTAVSQLAFIDHDVDVEIIESCAYEDVGGLDEEVRRIREMVELPIRHPDVFRQVGVEAPSGVLLSGPPGTGKTLLARAVAGESRAAFIHINGPEVMNKLYGESEARLRELFEAAQRRAPAIIFIDEIDAIAPKRREVFGDLEKRLVAQLLVLMDGLTSRGQVVVIGATNVLELVDPALRRPGRFDRELSINPPDRDGREVILKIHTRYVQLDDSVDLEHLADVTHGFVGADLAALCREAGMSAVTRFLDDAPSSERWSDPERLQSLRVTADDFQRAFREVEPTAVRELFADKATASWDLVGGLHDVRQQLEALIDLPSALATYLPRTSLPLPRGVLLTGGSGTGKTLVAHAFAGSAGLHFISVDPATLTSRWHGEAELAIRQTFRRAKQIAPCVVFFDELDTLAPARGQGDHITERLVSQLCVELDHLLDAANVLVIAATSRPESVDPSLLRPGRFDLRIELRSPSDAERIEVYQIHTRDLPLSPDVDLTELSKRASDATGADIAATCRSALMRSLRRHMASDPEAHAAKGVVVTMADFSEALNALMAAGKHKARRDDAKHAGRRD
jgi:transitional endoplasmic reticulum ATPase